MFARDETKVTFDVTGLGVTGGEPEIPSLPPVDQLVGDYVLPPRDAFLGTTRRVKLHVEGVSDPSLDELRVVA